eukprot:TRINITY_DN195_c0_g1_i1.p1 TRINITY_DN195_c0_g1~~TRINITY_DN195_c0_g1_i1.p1  ORF type:complete len:456 (-),score=147.78 TRINITY_DN195_c0_g1_i1:276-1568(-)
MSSCCSQKSKPCCQKEDQKSSSSSSIHEDVREFYVERLKNNTLQSNTTCSTVMPTHMKKALALVPTEISSTYMGCGSPLPSGVKGLTVLDLGCGSGRDCYAAAALVGEKGTVIGIDMTEEQLTVAKKHADSFCKSLGYASTNMKFLKGYIEDVQSAGVDDNSVDLVISNCVINLSPDKKAVLSSLYRALKFGGSLEFSDKYIDRRIDDSVRKNKLFWGECIGGALYINDFIKLAKEVGFSTPRLLTASPVQIKSDKHAALLGNAKFYSITFRLYKLKKSEIENEEEDYGQIATYLGTIPEHEHSFQFDSEIKFVAHKPLAVSGNVAAVLSHSWLASYFEVEGDRSTHYGPFIDISSRALWDIIHAVPAPPPPPAFSSLPEKKSCCGGGSKPTTSTSASSSSSSSSCSCSSSTTATTASNYAWTTSSSSSL